jgi:spermidine/putrescine-binding protein
MKKIFLIILIILTFTGCQKQNNNVLNVLNWSSYIPDDVINDFEKETNIKVNYGTYSSNEELLAKISAAKEGTYDVVFPSDYMVELMKEKGYLEVLDKTKLSNYKNIKEEYLNLEYDKDNEYSLPFLVASVFIAKNSEHIVENIDSYNDLLNEKYKNNIVMLDDQRIVIGIALLALGYDPNETNENKLKEAEEWLLKLKPNIKAFDSDSPKMFLISKEVDIGVIWNAEIAISMSENSSIEVRYPKEGTMISIDNYVVLKGSKNQENAYKFINYLLREDVMAKIIEGYPYKNVNSKSDSILPSSYISNTASNFSKEVLKNSYMIKNIGDKVKLYDQIWASIK